jgi:hypothetical protein
MVRLEKWQRQTGKMLRLCFQKSEYKPNQQVSQPMPFEPRTSAFDDQTSVRTGQIQCSRSSRKPQTARLSASCSERRNKPRTIGSTFERVSARPAPSGTGVCLRPAARRWTSLTRAPRRSSCPRRNRSCQSPDQAERNASVSPPLNLVLNGLGFGLPRIRPAVPHFQFPDDTARKPPFGTRLVQPASEPWTFPDSSTVLHELTREHD